MKGFAVVISLSVALCSASAQSLRAQLNAENKVIHKLMKAKDVKGFKAYMKGIVAPDFKYVEEGRTMNFDQMCAGMEMGLGQMKKLTKVDSRLTAVREKGDSGMSTSVHVMEGTTLGPDKKMHKMAFTGTSQDTYVKKGGKWLLSKMEWKNQAMTMDGKPMGAMATPSAKKQ